MKLFSQYDEVYYVFTLGRYAESLINVTET